MIPCCIMNSFIPLLCVEQPVLYELHFTPTFYSKNKKGKVTVKEQANLEQLKKRIEAIRGQLHVAFQSKRAFSDPDVYRLSLDLDDLIVEYQNRSRLDFRQIKSLR
ncbi:aspartyl-phosphate phosphatase Spo0E family protein [Effusibacillus consociatus]|uniref:Aspartyl-phosphate phosphatase Spo0E family protein n=1 Tax=Effusibacillus consociatus TaxID=1117041 RepID=A0ABV9Q637_9BACL